MTETETIKLCYEGLIKSNPDNAEAVAFLGRWYLERQSYSQAHRYFAHVKNLRPNDVNVLANIAISAALCEEFEASQSAITDGQKAASNPLEEVKIRFCQALLCEKQQKYQSAMDIYTSCLQSCGSITSSINEDKTLGSTERNTKLFAVKELRGEVMLRIAIIKKDLNAMEQSMQLCNMIISEYELEYFAVRCNALCLKGLLHEMRSEFPTSEIVYRSVLAVQSDHCIALERLGRVYLRYRETIPAAVQCFFKSVEINPNNHIAWYLLGRCYMATSQYQDACEAYNRSININPNDAQTWCSLGVLYYAFGQYKEALGMLSRALRLNPTMADAWYNVGALYDMCDQPVDAQQAYEKAKEFGVNERFLKSGMGINPITMQSLNPSSNPSAALTAAQIVQSQLQLQSHQNFRHGLINNSMKPQSQFQQQGDMMLQRQIMLQQQLLTQQIQEASMQYMNNLAQQMQQQEQVNVDSSSSSVEKPDEQHEEQKLNEESIVSQSSQMN